MRYIYLSKHSEAAESLLEPSGAICVSKGDPRRRRKASQSITVIAIWKIPPKSTTDRAAEASGARSKTDSTRARATFFQILRKAVTCARKLSRRQDPHHVREEICHGSHVMRIWDFFSASFTSCVRWRSLFPRCLASCARDRSPHFYAYAQNATKSDPDPPDLVQQTTPRPAQIQEGPEALHRCSALKSEGRGTPSEHSLKNGASSLSGRPKQARAVM